jgi:preprotein translocase subunit SecA
VMRQAEKSLLLQVLDHVWKEHLLHLDHLRQGIYLRGYGQKDPLNEYKREAFNLFDALLSELRQMVTQVMMQLQVRMPEPEPAFAAAEPVRPVGRGPAGNAAAVAAPAMALAMAEGQGAAPAVDPADVSTWGRVARNAPCPCGSGKKFKACHGSLT